MRYLITQEQVEAIYMAIKESPLSAIPVLRSLKPIEPLTVTQVYKIADSAKCNPDDRGWGPKFSVVIFANEIQSAITGEQS